MDAWAIILMVIIAYCLVTLVIGYGGYRVGKINVDDYFLGGRELGIFVAFFTYVATFHSSFAFLGAAGWIYSTGITFFAVFTSCVVSPLMVYYIGRPVWNLGKKYNFITPADLLADYYQSETVRVLVAGISLVFLIPYLQSQLMGAGYIFEAVTEGRVSFFMGTLFLYIIMIAYLLMGGFRVLAWTDTLQGILMIFLVWVGGLVVLGSVFGTLDWSVLMQRIASERPELVTIPLGYWPAYMTLFLSLFGISIYPPTFARFYAVKHPNVLKWLAVAAPVYLVFFYVPIYMISFTGALVMPGIERADMILPMMMLEYAPIWLTGLMMAGALAATMSSADSQLHVSSSIFTIDVYKRYINKTATEKQNVLVGRICIIVISGIALVMAQFTPQLLVAIVAIALGGFLQFLPPLVGALYWPKGTKTGAIYGMIIGTTVLLLTQFVWTAPLGIASGVWGLLANALVYTTLSYMTEAPSSESQERYHIFLSSLNSNSSRREERS